jgi:hypothetical protein
MSEKRGRPKKAIARREKNIGFYVTDDQYSLIQRKAEQAMVNVSDYMRQVAIVGEVRARWTAEERDMVRKLVGMSGDLHRMAGDPFSPSGAALGAEVLSSPSPSGAVFFMQLRDELDIIIKHLCHDR